MAGYDGFSMSNNAREAYSSGEMPISKWTKTEIINEIKYGDCDCECNFDLELLNKLTLAQLKKFLCCTSWHHTSMHFNKTDFYSIDTTYISFLTDEDINEMIANKPKQVKREQSVIDAEKAVKLEKARVKAEIEYLTKLFKYSSYKTLKGFLNSKIKNIEELETLRKTAINEKRESLRRNWENNPKLQDRLPKLADDSFVEGYMR